VGSPCTSQFPGELSTSWVNMACDYRNLDVPFAAKSHEQPVPVPRATSVLRFPAFKVPTCRHGCTTKAMLEPLFGTG